VRASARDQRIGNSRSPSASNLVANRIRVGHFEDAFAVCDSSILRRVVADARHLIGRASLTALGR
jgi:hypothetical protein